MFDPFCCWILFNSDTHSSRLTVCNYVQVYSSPGGFGSQEPRLSSTSDKWHKFLKRSWLSSHSKISTSQVAASFATSVFRKCLFRTKPSSDPLMFECIIIYSSQSAHATNSSSYWYFHPFLNLPVSKTVAVFTPFELSSISCLYNLPSLRLHPDAPKLF